MAKAIRFPLNMPDGTDARTLLELREHFDLKAVIEYYKTGQLLTWLKARYCEDEAAVVGGLKLSDSDFSEKLCAALGVKYNADEAVDPQAAAERAERLQKLKQYTSDPDILANVDAVAFDQEELYDRLDEQCDPIYLYGENIAIPSGAKAVRIVDLCNSRSETQSENEPSTNKPSEYVFYTYDDERNILWGYNTQTDLCDKTLKKSICSYAITEKHIVFVSRVGDTADSNDCFSYNLFCAERNGNSERKIASFKSFLLNNIYLYANETNIVVYANKGLLWGYSGQHEFIRIDYSGKILVTKQKNFYSGFDFDTLDVQLVGDTFYITDNSKKKSILWCLNPASSGVEKLTRPYVNELNRKTCVTCIGKSDTNLIAVEYVYDEEYHYGYSHPRLICYDEKNDRWLVSYNLELAKREQDAEEVEMPFSKAVSHYDIISSVVQFKQFLFLVCNCPTGYYLYAIDTTTDKMYTIFGKYDEQKYLPKVVRMEAGWAYLSTGERIELFTMKKQIVRKDDGHTICTSYYSV